MSQSFRTKPSRIISAILDIKIMIRDVNIRGSGAGNRVVAPYSTKGMSLCYCTLSRALWVCVHTYFRKMELLKEARYIEMGIGYREVTRQRRTSLDPWVLLQATDGNKQTAGRL